MKIKPSKKPGTVVVEVATKDTALLAQGNASQFRLTKILVPIDFSDCSKKALQYALAFAKHRTGRLRRRPAIHGHPDHRV